MATRSPQVDYFSRLPPELVLKVVLSLEVEDVCRCLLVSKRWYDLLSGLEPYWRKACVQIGLPEYQIRELRPQHATSKALLCAARKHRMSVGATPPRGVCLSAGYPVTVRYACQYARGRMVVGTVYKDFRPCEIVVDRIDRTAVTTTSVISPSFHRIAENRVVWGHADSSFLLCVTASGIWTGYDLGSNRCLFKWQGEPMYDSDLTIGCCDSCFMVCAARLFSFRTSEEESYWDLRVLRLGRDPAHQSSRIMRFKLATGRNDINPRRANCGIKRVCFVPSRTYPQNLQPDRDCHGFCQSHILLIQWANSIAAYTLRSRGESSSLSRRPNIQFTVPCRRLEEVVVRSLGLNTRFRLSSDRQLIGMIFGATLHVWNMQTGGKISSVEIVLEKYSYEQMRLIALGHVYSIIGLEFNDALQVVATQTGEVVLRCVGFAQKHGRMVPPYIEFLCAISEDWLSSISCPCSAAMPAVIYWNKTSRSIEGIAFGSLSVEPVGGEEGQPRQKRKRWWWGSWRK